MSRSRARAYSSRPGRSGADSIPESITTQGGLHPDTSRVHQQIQLDDLASRVLTLDTRLNKQNEFLQSSLQQIMQALNLPLTKPTTTTTNDTPGSVTTTVVPSVTTTHPNPTPPAPASNRANSEPIAQETQTAGPNPPTTAFPVPPSPLPHSEPTHQSSFDSPARHPPPNVVTQTTLPFFFPQQQQNSTIPTANQPATTTYPYAISSTTPNQQSTTIPPPNVSNIPPNASNTNVPVVQPTPIPSNMGHPQTIVHNPYGTSAPPVTAPPITPSTSTPSTLQQMLTMMQHQQQQFQKTIKFETFKEGKTLYSFWKAHSMAKLAASSDPFYQTMVIFDPSTTINTLNNNITPAQNSQLYFMTTAALGSTLAQQFISQRNAAASNGLKLWKDMDAQLLNREQGSAILKLNIRETYDQIKMNPSESILKYTNRYDEVYGKLLHNNMSHYTGIELTLHFIRSMQKPIIFADLLTKLLEPHNSKYLSSDLKEVGHHLQTYHDKYVTVHSNPYPSTAPVPAPTTPAPPAAPTNSTPVGAPTNNPGAAPRQRNTPAPAPTPTPTSTSTPRTGLHPAVAARLAAFKQQLEASSDPTTLIVTTHRSCETAGTPPCLFHTLYREGNSHKFINCSLLNTLCQETNKTPNLVTAKYTIRNGAPVPTPTVSTPVSAPAPAAPVQSAQPPATPTSSVQPTQTITPTPPVPTVTAPPPQQFHYQQPPFQYQYPPYQQYPQYPPYPPNNGYPLNYQNRYTRNSTPPRNRLHTPPPGLPPPGVNQTQQPPNPNRQLPNGLPVSTARRMTEVEYEQYASTEENNNVENINNNEQVQHYSCFTTPNPISNLAPTIMQHFHHQLLNHPLIEPTPTQVSDTTKFGNFKSSKTSSPSIAPTDVPTHQSNFGKFTSSQPPSPTITPTDIPTLSPSITPNKIHTPSLPGVTPSTPSSSSTKHTKCSSLSSGETANVTVNIYDTERVSSPSITPTDIPKISSSKLFIDNLSKLSSPSSPTTKSTTCDNSTSTQPTILSPTSSISSILSSQSTNSTSLNSTQPNIPYPTSTNSSTSSSLSSNPTSTKQIIQSPTLSIPSTISTRQSSDSSTTINKSTTITTNNTIKPTTKSQLTSSVVCTESPTTKSVSFSTSVTTKFFNSTKSTLAALTPSDQYSWYSLPEQRSSITNPKQQYQYSVTSTPTQLYKSQSQKERMRACIDSAASADMIPLKSYFESITYYDQSDSTTPSVMLGDEITLVPIIGYGLAKYSINNKTIRKGALYVPALGATALLSVKQHMENKGCYFHAESQKTTLAFPTFLIIPRVDKEIDVYLQPSSAPLDFDELTTNQVPTHQKSSEQPKYLLTTNQQQYNFIHQDVNSYPIIPESKTVFIKKLSPQAQLPAQGTPGSIGFDVTSTITVTLLPNTTTPVPTGLATAFSPDMYLRIASRSSMELKQITVKGELSIQITVVKYR